MAPLLRRGTRRTGRFSTVTLHHYALPGPLGTCTPHIAGPAQMRRPPGSITRPGQTRRTARHDQHRHTASSDRRARARHLPQRRRPLAHHLHDQATVRREAMLTARRPAFGGYRHDEWHPGASVAADVRRRRNLRKSQPACPAWSFRRSRIQRLALPRSSPAALQWVHAKHGPVGPFGQGARRPGSACSMPSGAQARSGSSLATPPRRQYSGPEQAADDESQWVVCLP